MAEAGSMASAVVEHFDVVEEHGAEPERVKASMGPAVDVDDYRSAGDGVRPWLMCRTLAPDIGSAGPSAALVGHSRSIRQVGARSSPPGV